MRKIKHRKKPQIPPTRKMNKIALFGGTFDPIHLGHVNLAQAAVEKCGLDQLIFVPNYISPFKQDRQVTSGVERSEMIQIALRTHPKFALSTYELERTGPSYTYDTLRHFREVWPDTEIHFVIGFDSVLTIDTWYHGEDILREYPLITAVRPGVPREEAFRRIEKYRANYGSRIQMMNIEPFDVSSSEIRQMVQRGERITELVPPAVEKYIEEHGLYRYQGAE